MYFDLAIQKSDTPLGLKFLGCRSGRGVYVNDVSPYEDSIASKVSVGDLLRTIEGKDVSQLSLHDVLSAIEQV